MHNYSINKQSISFDLLTKHIVIIDALYLADIKENMSFNTNKFVGRESIITLEQKFFPDSGGTLVGFLEAPHFKLGKYKLDPRDFKYWDDYELSKEEETLAQKKQITTFGSDTGLLIIADLHHFSTLIKKIDYDELVDYIIDEKLGSYFGKILDETKISTWGIVVLPEGGGSFKYDHKKIKWINPDR